MGASTGFLLHHGYLILFLAVLAEQAGLPVPSSPLLLAAGALAGVHRLNPFVVLGIAVTASLLSDSAWYWLGRQRGGSILGHGCRISLEPDTCVSRIHSVYTKYGEDSLLVCKFFPGLGTLGPPMAGMMGLAAWKFLLFDATGALIWSGTFFAVGFIFRERLEILAGAVGKFGAWFAVFLALALAAYIAGKYIQRKRLYRKLLTARITPTELRGRLDAHEKLIIVDLRNPAEWSEGRIPGSLQIETDKVDSAISAFTEAEVVLYCSCPNEEASAREALRLKRRGVRRVRPLEGGFKCWQDLGFPVEKYVRTQHAIRPIPG
jgi:membrane protein DedA with SNARE-associated domain/rhodanese-related sulfurtransferase